MASKKMDIRSDIFTLIYIKKIFQPIINVLLKVIKPSSFSGSWERSVLYISKNFSRGFVLHGNWEHLETVRVY